MKTPAIIVDLDGTLCDTRHRQHFMEQKPKDWKSFYAGIPNDPVNRWCLELIYAMCITDSNLRVIFVSGRPLDYLQVTQNWLHEHIKAPYMLYMRSSEDYRRDDIIKEEIYRKNIEPNYDVIFAVDDRKQVVDMWRRIGLTCLQCAEGNF